jgi:glycosyltransferase involved in cell wall biosynthesis
MDEERAWIDQTIEKTIAFIQQGGKFDMSVQVTIPNEFQRLAPINVGYTAGIETTKVAHQWIQKSNEMDKIIVVSGHSKQVFENTEYQAKNQQTGEDVVLRTTTPVEAVGYPVKTFESLSELDLELSTSFNFLTVAQFGPRKNLPNLIKWFVEEFRNEDVGLVIKTNIAKNNLADRNALMKIVTEKTRLLGERQCKVFILHGDMTDAEMHSLYVNPQINAFVSLPHGEGFGLPIFEAAYSGLPVVATGWSGQLDFLVDAEGKEQFYNVAFDLRQVQKEVHWDGVIVPDSMWAFAREGSAKEQMRACFENNTRREDYAEQLHERFSEQAMYEQFVGEVIGKSKLQPEPVTGISFCIPTNGSRPEKTNLTIKSIQREMGDFPHEIIIAGDVSKFTDNDGVILLDKSDEAHSRKVAALRNAAADNSKFETIVWCDDDVILGRGWLKNMLDHSAANGWEVLGNRVLLPDGGRYWDRATLNPHKMVDYSHPDYDKNLYQSSAFIIVRKTVFEKVRWDEECLVYADREGKIPEDVKYSLDLVKNSFRISFNQDCVVLHNDDTYCEFEELCLKKELITERFGIDFFASNCEEFEGLFVDS